MNRILPSTRWLVELQGFTGLDDDTVRRVDYGLRFSPLVCLSVTAIGTALASGTVLWWLLPFAVAGAVLPGHPFDVLYNHGLRYLTGGARIPRYPLPRRFACALASLWLIATASCFDHGAVLAGQILGWGLVAAAFVNVSTGFCVPSFIFRAVTGTLPARRAAQAA
jgi:hypothetical protein